MDDTKLKNLIRIGARLTAFVMMALGPTTSFAVASGQRLSVNPGLDLNMRADANPQSVSLDVLNHASTIIATGQTRDGWLQVDAGGVRGWVNGRYVSERSTEARYCATCQTAPVGNRLINAGRAVVRAVYNKVLSYADRISRYLWVGHRVPDYKCWRAVWNVLKRAGLVSGDLTQRYAKNALVDLRKFGFHHDASACNTKGVVRVYDSARPGYGIGTPGDYAGHIEILGNDGAFHHVKRTRRPMNERVGNRNRPLKYCLVKSATA